ncbi:MerR family transcriptional regulator [Rhizobium sp. P32RR-XVIII]|uniref:MerR family transcriptional regulator n=1 Tax=Rhizobium sp. P32RR-XVIII TaxID=2726738 RepID=UPI0014565465|nr:MerR family transcriptional regulator [Rhizobium sp. P32RR-XVIII]NLS05754.1 MerR family transcriptional regulator [Rhizobium sp. P32RR-XVIII]
MSYSAQFLSPSEAAGRLGISQKALRLYEQRGLIVPVRTSSGWRTYGPAEMARAAEIVALRALGLSLSQIGRVLKGDPQSLEPALAAHQATLENRIVELAGAVDKVRALRADITIGRMPNAGELVRLMQPAPAIGVPFRLPWPWGGEEFELREIRPLTFITGPLGSGKTRLAHAIAENLPDARFLGLDRLQDEAAEAHARLDADAALKEQVEEILQWLAEDGATISPALKALVVALQSAASTIHVIDMVEQGLEQASQEAVIAWLRRRSAEAKPLFLMTRSSVILDLNAMGPKEAIILCPPNHSPPFFVAPYPGTPGYEVVASCLAPPEVRARTEGMIAWRPQVA